MTSGLFFYVYHKAAAVIELYNPINNSLIRVPLEGRARKEIEAIWLGNNKFIIIFDDSNNTSIGTYKINDDLSIKNIAYTTEKNYGSYYFRMPKFNYYHYLVLNSDTVIFEGTENFSSFFKSAKTFYLYNYKANKFLRLKDCPYKGRDIAFHKINDYSFLIYAPNSHFGGNRVYVYTINRKAAKID